MSTTGIATDAMKSAVATYYGSIMTHLTLFRALALQSATSIGATTFSVDLSVAAGDVIVFDFGQASVEEVTVSSVSGAGPYTVTPTAALTKAHVLTGSNGGLQSHIPKTSATAHEVASITRSAANWGSPSPAGVVTSSAAAITVPSSSTVGSIAGYSASTAGTYYDATPVAGQLFPSSASYVPVYIETVS